MSKERYALSFDEMTRARHFFHKHADEYITKEFQMRTILGEMGQYPPSSEIQFCLDSFEGKINFNNFCNYCCYLKKKYSKPEPKDVDTVRAFVALGGVGDRTGDISTDDLRSTCKHFKLTIDIDAMIKEVDEDGSGSIDFGEFASMWERAQAEGWETELTDEERNLFDEESNAAAGGGSPGNGANPLSGSMKEEEPALDEEDNLVVVKGFLFPLQRKQTMAAELAARENAKNRKASRARSFVKLPPLGQSTRQGTMHNMAQSRRNDVDIGDRVVEEEEMEPAGLKPAPPQQQQQRQAPPAFVPPSPVILDFRGSYTSRKKNSSKKGQYSPRKPATARGSSSSSKSRGGRRF